MKFKSIRNRLVFFILLFITALLSLISISAYSYFRHMTKELIYSQQFSLVSVMAKSLDDKIKSTHNALIAVAKATPAVTFDNRVEWQKWLEERKGTQSFFNHGLFLLDTSGTCVAYTSPQKHSQETAEYFQQLYKKSSSSGWQFVSTPMTCSATHNPTLFMTAPVRDAAGNVRGVLCGAIDLQQSDGFFREIAEARLGSCGYMFLLSSDRTMIVHKDSTRIGAKDIPPGSNTMIDRAIAGFEGSGENISSRKNHYLTSVKRLGSTDWILAANFPYNEAMLPVTRARNVFLTVMALIMLAGVLLARRLGSSITRPLSDLTDQIQELTKPGADPEKYLISTEEGEIGTLTDSFNSLLLDARLREEQLHTLAGSLEEEIGERQKSEIMLRKQADDLLKNERRLNESHNELIATEEMLRIQIAEYEKSKQLLQESNERFQALHQASFGGICIHDNGVILDCNQGLAEMTGYSIDELVGMDGDRLVAEEYRELVLKNIRNDFDQPYEIEGMRKDGNRYHLRVRGKTVPYRGHTVRVSEFRDISERKQSEEERSRLERQFHHAQKMESLGVLAGGIAHDFNNILTVILGQCYIAREFAEPGQPNDPHIVSIEAAAHRAADLCRKMLTYAGKSILEQSHINMWMLVDEIVTMLQAAIKKNVTIELDLNRNVPVIIGDDAQIQQIVMNLIVNAADAIGDENGTIKISLTRTTFMDRMQENDFFGTAIPSGDYCRLTVSDSGCGMDKETQRRIFEPFFTTKFAGRGLGMSAILGIIKAHNGALQLTSSPGVGTVFKILFPLPVTPGYKDSSPLLESPLPNVLTGTVLLVDDENELLDVGSTMLKMLGLFAVTAANGREALELYRQMPDEIALVMLDINMPVMGGIEAYHELRSISPDVPVLFCSGYSAEDIEDVIENDDKAGFMAKPYKPSQLRSTLTKMM
jgi:PAS domain S-box-containing protein